MKLPPISLVYHSSHARPMPGCFPLFVIIGILLVAGAVMLFQVVLPPMMMPRGVGRIYYQQDELTRFRVRQLSALPLRLPTAVDPAEQLPVPQQELPLHPALQLVLPPSQLGSSSNHESAVLDDAYLLELPPTDEPETPQGDK